VTTLRAALALLAAGLAVAAATADAALQPRPVVSPIHANFVSQAGTTFYTIDVSETSGITPTYQWSFNPPPDDPACNLFQVLPENPAAASWRHGNNTGCRHLGESHNGTIVVVVTVGRWTATAVYQGTLSDDGPKPAYAIDCGPEQAAAAAATARRQTASDVVRSAFDQVQRAATDVKAAYDRLKKAEPLVPASLLPEWRRIEADLRKAFVEYERAERALAAAKAEEQAAIAAEQVARAALDECVTASRAPSGVSAPAPAAPVAKCQRETAALAAANARVRVYQRALRRNPSTAITRGQEATDSAIDRLVQIRSLPKNQISPGVGTAALEAERLARRSKASASRAQRNLRRSATQRRAAQRAVTTAKRKLAACKKRP
jgi:hypothetical protein